MDDSARFESVAGERFLLSVYEKASVEAAQEDFGDGTGVGYLFGLAVVDQAGLEQLLCMDYPGVDIFATDGEHYYIYDYPTDVQFYRGGGEIDIESEEWKTWETLNELGYQVREDMMKRNRLSAYSTAQFLEQPFTYAGEHLYMRYYLYQDRDGGKDTIFTLVLSQPAVQGEGGLWAVERWLDEYGYVYLYFPDSGKPSAEYYAQLQESAPEKSPELLTPEGAAKAFVWDYFGLSASLDSFALADDDGTAYTQANLRLHELVSNLLYGQDVDPMDLLDCVGNVSGQNWGTLNRRFHGSEWWPALKAALEDAAVGSRQQLRDQHIMALAFALQDSQMDYRRSIYQILQKQRKADEEAFQSALALFGPGEQELITAPPSDGAEEADDGETA